MSRNGSGTYSVPNTFTSGTTITASGHNENWSDVATEVTNSVAADGQTSMTGPLKAANGTVAAPAVTFASDPDSGMYRIGADNVGIATGGTKRLDVSSTGLDVTGTVKQNGLTLLPIGLGPLPWTDTTAPSGWILSGATYNRADYPDFWDFAETAIANGSTWFTNGNGTTTFTIASTAGLAVAGVDASATNIASFTDPGATAGASTRTIAQANLPNVNLSTANITVSGQVNPSSNIRRASLTISQGGGVFNILGDGGAANNTDFPWTHTGIGGSVPLGGSGTALSIIQPVRAVNFIFFAGV